jgi:hypothetical protein
MAAAGPNKTVAGEHEGFASIVLKDSTALCSMQSSWGQKSHLGVELSNAGKRGASACARLGGERGRHVTWELLVALHRARFWEAIEAW